MNEIRPHPLDIAHHFHAHAALVDFLEQNPKLEFGQTRTDTAMNAVAEGDMAPCVLARDVQLVGIVEHFLVAVGGDIPENDLVAFFDAEARGQVD